MRRLISRTFQLVLLRLIYFCYERIASSIGKLWLAKAPAKRKAKASIVFRRKLRTTSSYSTSNEEEIAGYDFWLIIERRGSDSSRIVQETDNNERYFKKDITYIGLYKTTNCTTKDFWEAWSVERFKTLKLYHYAYSDFYPIPFYAPSDIELILQMIYDDHKRQGFFSTVTVDSIVKLIGSPSVRNTMLGELFLSNLLPQLAQENLLEKKNSGYVISGKGITYLKDLENQRLTHTENAAISKRHNLLVTLLVIVGIVANWNSLVLIYDGAAKFLFGD